MTEKEFLRKIIEKDMPDMEQVRQNCLEQGIKQKRSRKAALRYSLAMAAVCVIAVISVGTGVCYAATGESPIRLFSELFRASDEDAVAQISESFAEPNAVIEFDNKEFTLDKYFFDKEQGIIFAEMILRTTDGTPVISWDDEYFKEMYYGFPNEVRTEEEKEAFFQENEEAFGAYKEACETAIGSEYLGLYWPLENAGANISVDMEDEETYHLYGIFVEEDLQKYEESESDTGSTYIAVDQKLLDTKKDSVLRVTYGDEIVGEISMENTGTIKYCKIDAEKIRNCTEVSLTGAYMQIYYENEEEILSDSEDFLVDRIDVTMSDGHIYRWNAAAWDFDSGVTSGTGRILTQEEAQLLEDEPGITKIHVCSSLRMENGKGVFDCYFPEFLNVDDIVSVEVDGVECLVK